MQQLVKGQKVTSSRSDYVGLVGAVESDGAREDGRVVVRWAAENDPKVTWSMLEDARRLTPVA